VERGILNTISIDFSNVKIVLDLFDFVWNDVVSYSPDTIVGSRLLLKCHILAGKCGQARLGLTGSHNVSQKALSMRVTTRPGA
jgi:hypothetical protein